MRSIKIFLYHDVQNCLRAFVALPEIRFLEDNLPELVTVGKDLDNQDIFISEALEDISINQTVWGFSDIKSSSIHFWDNGETSNEHLLQFFTHELSHLWISTSLLIDLQRQLTSIEDKEQFCFEMSKVSMLAYQCLQLYKYQEPQEHITIHPADSLPV